LADDLNISVMKNKFKKVKIQEDRTLWSTHEICSYINMYINVVADSVMLHIQHYFYNKIFKIKHNFYSAPGSAPPPPQRQLLSARLGRDDVGLYVVKPKSWASILFVANGNTRYCGLVRGPHVEK
jgi:hypothetical protein